MTMVERNLQGEGLGAGRQAEGCAVSVTPLGETALTTEGEIGHSRKNTSSDVKHTGTDNLSYAGRKGGKSKKFPKCIVWLNH